MDSPRPSGPAASPGLVRAPFTVDQVVSLNEYQASGWMHPFICGRNACPSRDYGTPLRAAPDGWHCTAAGCGYRQNWAHAWMADWSWKRILSALPSYSGRQRAA